MTPHVTFQSDGEAFLTSSWDRSIRLGNTRTGKPIWKRMSPPADSGKLIRSRRWNDQVRGLAVSPAGSTLATAGHAGDIKLWSAAWFD